MGALKKFENKLEKSATIAIDSSVFIYQVEDSREFASLTNIVFDLFTQDKITLITSTITVAEIFTKMINLMIVPLDRDLAMLSALIRGKYRFHLPDAIQVATAVSAKAKTFVTNDERLKKVKELEILCLSDFV